MENTHKILICNTWVEKTSDEIIGENFATLKRLEEFREI